jgi:prophage regulatory protein
MSGVPQECGDRFYPVVCCKPAVIIVKWQRNADSHLSKEIITMAEQSVFPTQERYILRRPDVEVKVGFKRAYLYELMKEGKFPRQIQLGVRAVGWDSVEIEQWILDRIQTRA